MKKESARTRRARTKEGRKEGRKGEDDSTSPSRDFFKPFRALSSGAIDAN
jgi:hypothetical protein